MNTRLTIVIEGELRGDGEIAMTLNCKPVIPVMEIAQILRQTAEEMEGGRLTGMRIKPEP